MLVKKLKCGEVVYPIFGNNFIMAANYLEKVILEILFNTNKKDTITLIARGTSGAICCGYVINGLYNAGYTLSGKFLRTFKSIIEAEETVHISNIWQAINKKGSSGGFQWRYFNGDTSNISTLINIKTRNTQLPIVMINKDTKEEKLYNSVIDCIKENPNFVDEVDIDNVEMKTRYKVAQRYNVEIIKDIIGHDITPKPEYLSFITSPKNSVIVAGYIKKIERKEFIRKTGKHAGEPKAYYNFQIADGKGKIDCIYFSPKKNEKDMDALEEYMYVLLHGDVKLNQLNKLCLYVDKIALATEVAKEEEEKKEEFKHEGPVVEVEKLTALEQDTMFEPVDKYNKKIMGHTIVVFDIETTGLDPATDQIIELGAVKIENGNIVEKFSTFVKPTKKLGYDIVNLTGITDEMLEDAPPIDLVIKDFYEFSKGCILCGHNIIGFDIKFIRREGENVGLSFDNEIIDTLNEARMSKLKISRFNLGTVVKALGLTLEGAHRAWNDAFATAQVLLKLNEV